MNRAAQIERWLKVAVLAGIVFAIAWGAELRVKDLQDIGARTLDERVYTAFSSQLFAGGWPAMPQIFFGYLHDPGSWDYPPPTRLSTLALVSSVMGITGVHDVRAGAWVDCATSIVSLILVGITGWRLFNPATALVATTLMAFCFTELAGARRSWQDTTLGAITLAALYVSSAIIRQPQAVARYAYFLALGVVLLLTKQSGALVYAICSVAIAMALYLQPQRWLRLALFAASCLASLAVAIWLLCLAAGGLQPALDALLHSIKPGAGTQAYMATALSAPPEEFLSVLFMLNPFVFTMEVIGFVALLRTAVFMDTGPCDGAERINAALIATLFLAFVLFVGLYPGAQDLRFFSPATAAGCLLAAIGSCRLVERAQRKSGALAIAAAMILAAAGILCLEQEYAFYQSRIVAGDLQDLCVSWLHV